MGTVMAGTARCREEEEEEWGRRGRGGGEEEEDDDGETSLLWRALERLLVWQRVGEEEGGGGEVTWTRGVELFDTGLYVSPSILGERK